MQITKTLKIEKDLQAILGLLVNTFALGKRDSNGQYVWQARSSEVTITAYKSGKVVIQSKNGELVESIIKVITDKYSEADVISKKDNNFSSELDVTKFFPHIGTDEVGKGDFFGGLFVAGVAILNEETNNCLIDIGVRDSKKLKDVQIQEMTPKIFACCTFTKVFRLSPSQYNDLYSTHKNVNKLLSWAHAQVIGELLEQIPPGICESVVIDQFSTKESRMLEALDLDLINIPIIQRHRAESSDLAVAAASIIARGAFLESMAQMNKDYEMNFPLGATNVISTGKEFVEKYGSKRLGEVAKISFRTAETVLNGQEGLL